ncbi:hypothetical protein T07_467 [Trichinella nelsoni]|uniref:Uncharacterized protein n=1 Tax=Trichinella nelsoni TaxID=6336 RepID=A0A0V0RBU7_9BILA|nr:hypothetical protein T07_467 [Trichinella nelsoni]
MIRAHNLDVMVQFKEIYRLSTFLRFTTRSHHRKCLTIKNT